MRAPSIDLLQALRTTISSRASRQLHHCAPARNALSHPRSRQHPESRSLHTSVSRHSPPRSGSARTGRNPLAPKTHDRGPASDEDTQTDFNKMDIFGGTGTPATSIDACTTDGFHLNNGVKTTGGHGVFLLGGEAFLWRPWVSMPEGSPEGSERSNGKSNEKSDKQRIGDLLDRRGVLAVPDQSWAVLDVLYPKPDLLIVGTGSKLWMLSPDSRRFLSTLGVKVDVMDTGNAAAAYNLLATERGVEEVAGCFLPVGWLGRARR